MSNGKSSQTHVTAPMSGWIYFAGFLMIVAGLFQALAGVIAIFKPTFYVSTQSSAFVLDFTQWGWIHLIFGIVLMISAASLFAGNLWGRIVAITLATISAIINFAFIWAYPLWSIMIVVLDIIIIYSVAMYGGRPESEA